MYASSIIPFSTPASSVAKFSILGQGLSQNFDMVDRFKESEFFQAYPKGYIGLKLFTT